MRPPLSIIIPLYNDHSAIAHYLPMLMEQLPEAELIVADGGSADGGLEWAERRSGVHLIRSPLAQRAFQMNLGARAASGEYLLFLHADTALSAEAVADLKTALARGDIAAGAFQFALDAVGLSYRIMEWGVWLRCKFFSLPYGDQGLFIRRSLFEEIGGFPEMPMMEDVAIVDKINAKMTLHLFQGRAITSARRWEKNGPWRMMFINWRMMLAYRSGMTATKLAAWRRKL